MLKNVLPQSDLPHRDIIITRLNKLMVSIQSTRIYLRIHYSFPNSVYCVSCYLRKKHWQSVRYVGITCFIQPSTVYFSFLGFHDLFSFSSAIFITIWLKICINPWVLFSFFNPHFN